MESSMNSQVLLTKYGTIQATPTGTPERHFSTAVEASNQEVTKTGPNSKTVLLNKGMSLKVNVFQNHQRTQTCNYHYTSKRNKEITVAAQAKTNPKSFYKYVNDRRLKRDTIGPLIDSEGSTQTNNKSKAKILNTYFTSVFTHEDLTEIPQPPVFNTQEILSDGVFTVEEVEEQLSILNPYKSTGPDGLGPRILKKTAEVISEPLTNIFNRSLETGIVPDDWKRANVTPIFNKGNKQISNNYRPISLTSVISKTIERLLKMFNCHSPVSPFKRFADETDEDTYDETDEDYHQIGRLVSESACERKDPGSNPAADMVDAARNTAWDLGKQPNNYRNNYPTQEWARRQGGHKNMKELKIYRPIALADTISKIFCGILNERMKHVVEEQGVMGEEQNGFRRDRRDEDNWFVMERGLTGLTGYGPSNLTFDGNDERYELWEVKFRAYLDLKSLNSVLEGEESSLDVVKNKQVFSELVQRLDDKSLSLIIRDAYGDGRKSMKILRDHYLGSSKPRISRLDYAAPLYGTAAPSNLSKLNSIQNQCLRIATKSSKTTLITSLQIEADIPPVALHREETVRRYYCRLLQLPLNIATSELVQRLNTPQIVFFPYCPPSSRV
ncbi:hypothetical protein FHG87_014938 [Trinorchestia longiramus]|nr:hypothetical protein FHG87_014938 [Trinorchestia longiramus]